MEKFVITPDGMRRLNAAVKRGRSHLHPDVSKHEPPCPPSCRVDDAERGRRVERACQLVDGVLERSELEPADREDLEAALRNLGKQTSKLGVAPAILSAESSL